MNQILVKPPALFLDRDGIVIHDSGYAKEATKVRLLPQIASLIRLANRLGWKTVVVTNQSGLGRGWIELSEYEAVSDRMLQLLNGEGARVDQIYFAPFHVTAGSGADYLQSPSVSHHGIEERGLWSYGWRKPMPGMLWSACRDHNVDLSRSVMIGDRATDQIAGFLAGVPRTFFYKSSLFEAEKAELPGLRDRLVSLYEESRAWLATQSDLQKVVSVPGTCEPNKFQPIEIEHFDEVNLL